MTPERTIDFRLAPSGDDGFSLLQWGDPARPNRMQSVRMPSDAVEQILDAAAQLAQLRAILEPLRALDAAAEPAPWHHFHDEGHSCDCGQIWSKDDLLFLPHVDEGCETPEERKAQLAMRKPSGKLAVAARNAVAEMLRVTGGQP